MRPDCHKFDTTIVFRQRTATQDATYGTQGYAWADFATELADVQDVLPSRAENLADGINIQRRPARVRLHYRDDITSDMRITIEGRSGEFEIIAGPVELGRRDGLELMVEQNSSSGEAP